MKQVLAAILGGILLVGALQGCSISPAQQEAIRQAWEERDVHEGDTKACVYSMMARP